MKAENVMMDRQSMEYVKVTENIIGLMDNCTQEIGSITIKKVMEHYGGVTDIGMKEVGSETINTVLVTPKPQNPIKKIRNSVKL